ncbi:MAG TPA: hypothetical protein VLM39_00050, partial [Ignavibacteriaceae bacterium]|nr:hypothetical protein [Ignavibacteriaceae bacterium]
IPTWVFKGITATNPEYVIIPVLPDYKSSIADYFSKENINSMVYSFDDCNYILTKYTGKIKLFKEQMIHVNIKPRGYELPENSFFRKDSSKKNWKDTVRIILK